MLDVHVYLNGRKKLVLLPMILLFCVYRVNIDVSQRGQASRAAFPDKLSEQQTNSGIQIRGGGFAPLVTTVGLLQSVAAES